MNLTEEDWTLIVGLWDERDRLCLERDRLETELARLRTIRASWLTQTLAIKGALGSVKRDLLGLSDPKIAEKFEINPIQLRNHPRHDKH